MRVSRIALVATIAVITAHPLLGQDGGQAPGRGQGGARAAPAEGRVARRRRHRTCPRHPRR
jgi:hypothetical protein